MSEFATILTSVDDGVATITIDRPKALNALNLQVLTDITDAATAFDADDSVRAIIITGAEKAFAAGADIKEMADLDFATAYRADWFAGWERLTSVRKPIITAVGGYALGGGRELAMMGDILIAATTAKFGQPEINLGVLPGMGGSRRLTRAVGKAKAMDMCLTGRMMDAEEAERSGLVARVVAPEELLATANEIARTIAGKSLIASAMVKEAIDVAFETTLEQGLRYERRLFHSALATNDQSEGHGRLRREARPELHGLVAADADSARRHRARTGGDPVRALRRLPAREERPDGGPSPQPNNRSVRVGLFAHPRRHREPVRDARPAPATPRRRLPDVHRIGPRARHRPMPVGHHRRIPHAQRAPGVDARRLVRRDHGIECELDRRAP